MRLRLYLLYVEMLNTPSLALSRVLLILWGFLVCDVLEKSSSFLSAERGIFFSRAQTVHIPRLLILFYCLGCPARVIAPMVDPSMHSRHDNRRVPASVRSL